MNINRLEITHHYTLNIKTYKTDGFDSTVTNNSLLFDIEKIIN